MERERSSEEVGQEKKENGIVGTVSDTSSQLDSVFVDDDTKPSSSTCNARESSLDTYSPSIIVTNFPCTTIRKPVPDRFLFPSVTDGSDRDFGSVSLPEGEAAKLIFERSVQGSVTPFFTVVDLLYFVLSGAQAVVSIGVDLRLAVEYHHAGMVVGFWLTLLFVFIPGVVAAILYLSRHFCLFPFEEGNEGTWRCLLDTLLAITGLQPVIRAALAFRWVMESKRAEKPTSAFHVARKYSSELTILGVAIAVAGCLPQAILQLVLMEKITTTRRRSKYEYIIKLWQWICVAKSSFVIAWTASSAFPNGLMKRNPRVLVKVVRAGFKFLALLVSIWSRVIVFYLFAKKFGWWLVLVCGLHCFLAWMWLTFSAHSWCTFVENTKTLTLALFQTLTYISNHTVQTTARHARFIFIMSLENILLLGLAATRSSSRDEAIDTYRLSVTHCLLFFLGVFFLLVYDNWLHPTLERVVTDDRTRRKEVYHHCYDREVY